jgi:hypothetical protein
MATQIQGTPNGVWRNEQTAIVWHWLNSSPTRRSMVAVHAIRGDVEGLRWWVLRRIFGPNRENDHVYDLVVIAMRAWTGRRSLRNSVGSPNLDHILTPTPAASPGIDPGRGQFRLNVLTATDLVDRKTTPPEPSKRRGLRGRGIIAD